MKKVKKVLVLNPYLPTLGGGEKHMGYLCQFIEEYYNYNVDIDILVHNYNEIDIHSDDYVTINDVNNQFGLNLQKTKIIKVDLPQPTNEVEFLKTKMKIEKMTKNYDLFINFMFFSKHIGKAKVNIYQCMFPPKPFIKEMGSTLSRKLIAWYSDTRFYASYDSIIANSYFTKQWLETYWKKRKKNTVIFPPVFSNADIEGRYDETKKKNIIISCGRFFVASHSKKQLEMVQFFVNNNKAFKNYEYHLVGALSNLPEDIEYVNTIQKLADTVNNVFLHPNYEYSKLINLYCQAKIFWHGTGYGVDENIEPEKMEHFGITTVEAMSFGAVPVVINKGGQKETVENGVNGFRWENEKECVENTVKLIEDDNLRKKMAEESVQRSKQYSIEEFYEMNRRIFNELHI